MCGYIFRKLTKWRVWRTLLLGQFLSGLLCATGVTSHILQDKYNIAVPTAQSFLNYFVLCLIFTTWLALKPGEHGLLHVLKKRGWKYFFLATIDVEANFLVVKAFQYTTLNSIQLLDCFTIPVVLLMSWLCVRVRYGIVHVLGVCLALVGVGCLVYADVEDGRPDMQPKNRFLGDMLCVSGAALYGVSNVAEEYVVKSYSIVEFLGMIGLFGSIVSGVQIVVLEKEQVSSINWEKWQEVSLLLAFSACLLLLYITMPLVLQISSATAVNISVLTADFYSLLIGLYLFQFKFHWLYILSFTSIITGVVIYNLEEAPSLIDDADSDENLPSFGAPFFDKHDYRSRRDYHSVSDTHHRDLGGGGGGRDGSECDGMTPSSTTTNTTCIGSESRMGGHNSRDMHPGYRLYQEQEGAFYPQTLLPNEVVVSVHAAPTTVILDDDQFDVHHDIVSALEQKTADQQRQATLKRNGVPHFIWEDSC